jgi:hypothetical protein
VLVGFSIFIVEAEANGKGEASCCLPDEDKREEAVCCRRVEQAPKSALANSSQHFSWIKFSATATME